MVPLFVGYALIIWYLTGIRRRRLIGAGVVVSGLAGLLLLNWFHVKLGHWTEGEIFVPVLQTITYPYTIMVVFVAGFIWCIPQTTLTGCHTCQYELAGLAPTDGTVVCPECGAKNSTRSAYRRSGADRASFNASDDAANTAPRFAAARARSTPPGPAPLVIRTRAESAPAVSSTQDAPQPADAEDRDRHPADERPAQHALPTH